MQPVADWAGLVAKLNATVFGCNRLHNTTHALFRGIYLPKKANLAAPLTVRNCDGVPHLGNIDAHENLLYCAPWLVLLQ